MCRFMYNWYIALWDYTRITYWSLEDQMSDTYVTHWIWAPNSSLLTNREHITIWIHRYLNNTVFFVSVFTLEIAQESLQTILLFDMFCFVLFFSPKNYNKNKKK